MSAPNTVQAGVIQQQAPPSAKGHILGTLASVGIGLGTGNWVPAITSVLGAGAGGAAQAVQSSTSTPPATKSTPPADSSQGNGSGSGSAAGSAADTSSTPLGDTPATVHQKQATQISDQLTRAPQDLSHYIDPTTGQPNPMALLALLSSGNSGSKQGPGAQQVQQSLQSPAVPASPMHPSLAAAPVGTPAFGAGALGQAPTNQFA